MSGFEALGNPVVFFDLFDLTTQGPVEDAMDDLRANLESFSIDEDRKQVGELTLVFNNPGGIYDDDERLIGRDKVLRVRWGHLTHLSGIKTCVIVSVTPRYPDNGVCKLEVRAWDAVSRAFLASYPRNWGRVSTSYIARQIAARWDLTPIVPKDDDDVRSTDYVQPGKMSDLEYLKHLAHRKGWEAWSDGVNLYFGPEGYDEAPHLSVVYGAGIYPQDFSGAPVVLTSFEPTLKQMKRPHTRRVAVDPYSKASVTHKADASTVSAQDPTRKDLGQVAIISFVDRSVDFKSVAPSDEEAGAGKVQPTAEPKQEQVTKDTAAEHWNIARRAAEAKAQFVGNCEIRVGRILDIQGVAETHSGKWMVTGTRHTISNASQVYTTSASLSRPGKQKGAPGADKSANPNLRTPDNQQDVSSTTKYNVSFEDRTVSREQVTAVGASGS